MPYVSARYMPPGPIEPPNAPRQIQAVDDQGLVWSLTEDSQVGDWLRYLEGGGTIDPESEPRSAPAPALPQSAPPSTSDPYDGEAPVAEPNVVYGDPLPE